MKNFIIQYGWIVLLVAAFGVYVVRFYSTKGRKETLVLLRETAFQLMQQAEKKFGKDEGEFKFEWVISSLYDVMPKSFRFMFTKDSVVRIVQNEYDKMKDFLDDGEINNSVK